MNLLRKFNPAKTVFLLSLASLISVVIFVTVNTSGLYGDGSHMFTFLVSYLQNHFFFVQNGREFVYLLQQFIMVLAGKLGVSSPQIFMYLHSFNFAFAFAFVWTLCLTLTIYLENKSYFYMTVLQMAVSLTFFGFLTCQEMLMCAPVFWFLFVYFLHYRDKDQILGKIGITLLSVFSTRIYQTSLFFGVMVFLAIVYRLWKKEIKLSFFVALNALLSILASLIAAYTALFRSDPNNADNFKNSLLNLPIDKIMIVFLIFLFFVLSTLIFNKKLLSIDNLLFYLSITAALLFIIAMKPAYFVGANASRRHLLYPVIIVAAGWVANFIYNKIMEISFLQWALKVVCIFGAGALLLYLSIFQPVEMATGSYAARSFSLIITFAFMCFAAVSYIFELALDEKLMALSAPIYLASMIFVFAAGGNAYSKHLRQMNHVLQVKEGLILAVDTPVVQSPFYTGWTIVHESIWSQVLFSDKMEIGAVLVQDKTHISWEPFNSYDLTAYPDLTRYGITYDLYPTEFSVSANKNMAAYYYQGIYPHEKGTEYQWMSEQGAMVLRADDKKFMNLQFEVPENLLSAREGGQSPLLSVFINKEESAQIMLSRQGTYDINLPIDGIEPLENDLYHVEIFSNSSFPLVEEPRKDVQEESQENEERLCSIRIYHIGQTDSDTVYSPYENYPTEFTPKQNMNIPNFYYSGFYDSEQDYQWMSRNGTCILRATDKDELQFIFVVTDLLSVQSDEKPIAMDIKVNGLKVQTVPLDHTGGYSIQIPLDKKSPPEDGAYHLEFDVSSSYTPKNYGLYDDTRNVSIAVYYIG